MSCHQWEKSVHRFCLLMSRPYVGYLCIVAKCHQQREILSVPAVILGGREITPYLVGDSAYPLIPWLVKPYPEGTRDPHEITFKKKQFSARVECKANVLLVCLKTDGGYCRNALTGT